MTKNSEIEQRIEELLKIVNNSNSNTTVIDGGTLNQINNEINGLKQQIIQLNKEKLSLKDLKITLGENNFKDDKYIGGSVTTQPPISTKPVDTPSSEEVAWNTFFSNRADITNQADWKKSGLSIEDAEKVYKNGWKDQISDINKNGKLDYKKDQGLDARTVNKNHLDTANDLLQEINDPNKNSFLNLPENFKEQEIKDLSAFDGQLPAGKKSTDLKQTIKTRRSTFVYSLFSPEYGGITTEKYAAANTNLQKAVYTPKKYRPLTAETLNRLFGLEKNKSNPKEINLDEPSQLYNNMSFWKNKGGYDMDPAHVAEEKEWGDKNSPNFSPWRLGELLLRDSYEINHWDPDNPVFVEWEEREVEVYIKTDEVIEDLSPQERKKAGITFRDIKKEKRKMIKPKQGHLAIGTALGKTTRTNNCMCQGGKRNIILVSPNQALAIETHSMHEGLQKWGCVYHKISDGGNRYKSHGPYPVALNDLVHEETSEEGDVEMKNGISVMNPNFLLGYLARGLCDINKIDPSVPGRDRSNPYTNAEGEKEWIKQKLIPENSIIVFDEAHFGDLDYQEIILYTIFLSKQLKYNVLPMSATFPGVPFSLNSSFVINSYEVNLFSSKLDSRLAQEKTFAFVKNIKDIDKKILEEKDEQGRTIAYCPFDVPFESASTGISHLMPEGSFMWGNLTYEMGFTFDIENVISSGEMEVKNLGAGWKYEKSIVQRLPDASQVQIKGRVGRKKPGNAYFLDTKSLEDEAREGLVIKKDKKRTTTTAIIKAVLSGDAEELKGKYFSLANVDLLRAALAIPSRLFGQPPEVVLIGLNTKSDMASKPTFGVAPTRVSANYSKELWSKHQGTWKAPKVEKSQANEVFKLMILTYIRKQKTFPQEVKLKIGSPLILDAELNEDEARGVINSVIREKLWEADPDLIINPNKTEYKENEKDKYDKVIPLLTLAADLEIEIGEETENGVKKGVLKVNYPVKVKGKTRALEGPLPKIIAWQCDSCDKWNGSNKFCQGCWLGRKKEGNKLEVREEVQVAQVLQES